MTRKTLQRLLLVVVALFSLSAMAEAAGPKRIVHRRPKHSTRVASGARTPRRKKIVKPQSRTTARSKASIRRKPTTKPR